MGTRMEQFAALWTQALDIWMKGGWCMPAIAATALLMFALGISIQMRLHDKRFLYVKEKTWRRWVNHPGERKGPIGGLLDFAMGNRTMADLSVSFRELRAAEAKPFERDLRVMKICVGVAPLLGLLGTVTGMLATFSALATGSGGDKTMAMVASGISEALITTETGLVIALPGLFFQYSLGRLYNRYQAFLAHVETVCAQHLYKTLKRQEKRAKKDAALPMAARAAT